MPVEARSPNFKRLNPASLLVEPDPVVLIHDCAEIIDEVFSSRIDLQDHPLEEADWTAYADGSSYMDKGNRKGSLHSLEPGDVPLKTWMAAPPKSQLEEKRTKPQAVLLITPHHGEVGRNKTLDSSHQSKEITGGTVDY
ncbi:uncharacterized protein AAES06_015784 [Glossophaga mutica]